MNWKKIWFGLIAIGIPVVLLAQSIKWYNDAAIPHKTAPVDGDILSMQQTGPNAYRWFYASDLKRYVGASNVTIITTNNVVYGSNYYVNNTYVSNFFETNILNNTVVSNYFFDFIYYTNIYQTNVTVNQYVSSDTYVSNFITTNIYNDTYTSNYFTTNLFPTTYVYVTNTIGGAFIANLGGMGTNTAFFGGTMFGSQLPNRLLRLDSLGFLDTLPNDTGILTNDGFGGLAWEPLPASSPQVWTNDAEVLRPTSQYTTVLLANNPSTNIHSQIALSVRYDASGSSLDIEGGVGTNLIDFNIDTLQKRLISYRTDSYDETFKVNFDTGDIGTIGIYYGDGSGLTNLNVTATTNLTVYETINVKNLNVTSNIYYLNAKATNVTWVGPTNTVDFSKGTVQSYVTADPISITNVIGEMAAYQNSVILCISNSSANVITNTLTATGWKLGRFDTLVCTNAGVIQIWLQNIGGMKTVAVREYP